MGQSHRPDWEKTFGSNGLEDDQSRWPQRFAGLASHCASHSVALDAEWWLVGASKSLPLPRLHRQGTA